MALISSGMLAAGHVLLDYVGEVPAEMAGMLDALSCRAHVGAAAMADIAAAIDRDKKGKRPWRAGGGAALTVMAWARLGLPAVLVGCVGRDEGGELLKQEIVEAGERQDSGQSGIELCLAESDKPTGRFCRFLAPAGEKIVASPSAAKDIRGFAIPERFYRKGWALHLDGLLVDDPDWLGGLAGKARAAGMIVSMDISTSFNAAKRGRELAEFAGKHCDIVFANEKEWEMLRKPVSALDPSSSTTIWVVKRGGNGASALERGEWTSRPAARLLEPGDDTGAGDAFAAGFLAARLSGETIDGCLAKGNEIAYLLLSLRS